MINCPWIDEQYVNRVGYKLSGFVKASPTLYRCKCPICGDSKKRSDLSRGYFIRKDAGFSYYCHNCGASHSLYGFLTLIDQNLRDEYSLELYKEKHKNSPPRVEKSNDLTIDDIPKARLLTKREVPTGLISMSDIDENHPALQYVLSRKVPIDQLKKLFFVSKYRKWNSPLLKRKYDDRFPDHPRLVIPYYWTDKSIFRYAARAFGKESPRYQQTIIDVDKPRVFGIDGAKQESLLYVLEGQLDSLFLPNAVAVGSANYNIPILDIFEERIYVPDNQPRNKDVVNQFKKLVDRGEKVCIWKEDYGKDINKMVIDHNLSQKDLIQMISESTYSGFEAQLMFKKWRKC